MWTSFWEPATFPCPLQTASHILKWVFHCLQNQNLWLSQVKANELKVSKDTLKNVLLPNIHFFSLAYLSLARLIIGLFIRPFTENMLCAPVNWKSLVREKERKKQQFMSQFSRSGLLGTSPSTNEGKCSFIRTWRGGWCCRSNPRASYCQFAGLCGFSVGKDTVQTWCSKMKSQRAGQMGHVPCSGDEGSMGDGQMRLATNKLKGRSRPNSEAATQSLQYLP